MKRSKKWWHNGDRVQGVVKLTSDTVVHQVQPGKTWGRYIFVGNGHSMDVRMIDESDGITTKVEPLMKRPNNELWSDNDNVFNFYPTFECKGGLEAVAKDMANLINHIPTFSEIVLVGHSKCAVCILKMHQYIDTDIKCKFVLVSGPFRGTPMGSREQFKALVSKRHCSFLMPIYNMIFSDHVVDHDIAVESEFTQGLPNIEEVCKYRKVLNCITTVSGPVRGQIRGIQPTFCKILARLTGLDDGIVSLSSQTLATQKLSYNPNFQERTFQYAHDNSLEKVLKALLMEEEL